MTKISYFKNRLVGIRYPYLIHVSGNSENSYPGICKCLSTYICTPSNNSIICVSLSVLLEKVRESLWSGKWSPWEFVFFGICYL